MPLYMLHFSYTQETWASLTKKPEDRSAAIEAVGKAVGGRLISLYYHFGEFDGTAIVEAPDDNAMNAAVLAVISSGALRSTKTVRLYTPKELIEALGKAQKVTHRPPGKA